jgi:hypothetical protein
MLRRATAVTVTATGVDTRESTQSPPLTTSSAPRLLSLTAYRYVWVQDARDICETLPNLHSLELYGTYAEDAVPSYFLLSVAQLCTHLATCTGNKMAALPHPQIAAWPDSDLSPPYSGAFSD